MFIEWYGRAGGGSGAGGRQVWLAPAAASARPPRSDTRRRLVNETTQLYLFNDHYLIGKKLASVSSLSPQGLCQVYPTWGVRRAHHDSPKFVALSRSKVAQLRFRLTRFATLT